MSRPFQSPHPDPWGEYGYMEAELRWRFACFEEEPWFKFMVVEFADCDNEWREQEIIEALEQTAKRRGIEVPPRCCNICDTPSIDVTREARTCGSCLKKEEEEEAREAKALEEFNALPEEEKERIRQQQQFILSGLMERDVQ